MDLFIAQITEVELPNYVESTGSPLGGWTEREAPLLAKYQVDLISDARNSVLFFEVRETPHGPFIDEYYEDQVYDELIDILAGVRADEAPQAARFDLERQIIDTVHNIYAGQAVDFPVRLHLKAELSV
ncbi:MAG: hypothetical protein H0X08_05850 [Blastocatellia bacterium]|nr:hypothetical protein [Blastocatellia bacterium]